MGSVQVGRRRPNVEKDDAGAAATHGPHRCKGRPQQSENGLRDLSRSIDLEPRESARGRLPTRVAGTGADSHQRTTVELDRRGVPYVCQSAGRAAICTLSPVMKLLLALNSLRQDLIYAARSL